MRRLIGAMIRLIAVGGMLLNVGGEVSASPPMFDMRPHIITSSTGLLVEWRAPRRKAVRLPDGTVRVEMPGYSQTEQPGQPQLPFTSVLIALPPEASPTVRILDIEESEQSLPGDLRIAPRPDGISFDAGGNPTGGAYAAAEATAVRHDPIELEDVGVMRGTRLARLTFFPVRPIDQTLRFTTHVRASIDFNSPVRLTDVSATTEHADPILDILRRSVANPEHVQLPTSNLQTPASSLQSAVTSSSTAVIEVNTPGITAITYEALSAVGFPVASAEPANLHLTRAGNEIAAEWDGDADATFEPGERLLFYADPRFHRYSTTDAYFLSIESTPGLRMTSRSVVPTGSPAGSAWLDAFTETNAQYTPECYCGLIPPGHDGDRWTWDVVRRPDRANLAYPIQLPTVHATQPATLTLWLIGYTDILTAPIDHRVDVALNNAPLGRVEWNGKQSISTTLPITPGILLTGTNTMSLTLPGISGVSIEGMWLDAFSIRYARGSAPNGAAAIFDGESETRTYTLALTSTLDLRAYDVTSADSPLRLTGVITSGSIITFSESITESIHRYALASSASVLSPANLRLRSSLQAGVSGADYVLIAPVEFTPALSDLIALRQSQGLTVAVETTQAIYDNFGDGRMDPVAIRAFLANAYATWSPRPTYVVLVGDGTFDPKRYRDSASYTLLPPYLADVDPWIGETAADNRFVTVDGGDNLPDMLIGRLPVNALAEVQIVVNKIVQYETQGFSGAWHGRAIFAADNPDSAGDFHATSDYHAASIITAPVATQAVYYAPPTTTVTATHNAILNQWNSGASLIMYTGHASRHQWAAERLLHYDDVFSLTNASRLPVVLQMTCLTGSFHNPTLATLDEALLRHSNGGAIAVWGPTGLGVSTGHTQLAEGFLESVYLDGQPDLGLAAQSGKLRLAATQPFALDLLDTFHLLGDPATQLNLISYTIYVPLVRR